MGLDCYWIISTLKTQFDQLIGFEADFFSGFESNNFASIRIEFMSNSDDTTILNLDLMVWMHVESVSVRIPRFCLLNHE